MEKNIKKRVCRSVLALVAVLAIVFVYRFLISPTGYWQSRVREADKEEYMDRRMLWRKSEAMTMQRMLQDLTLLADGDSLMVCWLTNINIPVYRDFIHGKAQPTRLTWANTRYWYMTAIHNGREWMQQHVKERKYKSLELVGSSLCGVQRDSTKDYHREAITSTETRYNKVYPKLGKPADKEFEAWREKKNKRWVPLPVIN